MELGVHQIGIITHFWWKKKKKKHHPMVIPISQSPVRKTETTRNSSNRGNIKPRINLHGRVEGPTGGVETA